LFDFKEKQSGRTTSEMPFSRTSTPVSKHLKNYILAPSRINTIISGKNLWLLSFTFFHLYRSQRGLRTWFPAAL